MAFAGRTDAAVHARGQVASFVTGSHHEPEVFVRGLNHWLPDDIAVQRASEVPLDFDVRRRARSREYRYLVLNSPLPSPLLGAFTWQVAEPLGLEAMRNAAALLVGRHDFAAFAGPVAGSTVRSLRRCELKAWGRLLVGVCGSRRLPPPPGAAYGGGAGAGRVGPAIGGATGGPAARAGIRGRRTGGAAARALPDESELSGARPEPTRPAGRPAL